MQRSFLFLCSDSAVRQFHRLAPSLNILRPEENLSLSLSVDSVLFGLGGHDLHLEPHLAGELSRESTETSLFKGASSN